MHVKSNITHDIGVLVCALPTATSIASIVASNLVEDMVVSWASER